MAEEQITEDAPQTVAADSPDAGGPAEAPPPDSGAQPLGLAFVNRYKDSAEVLGKLFLALLGICYATGLIVVNTRLNEYGIYSLSLVQANYITAGILAWLPILVPLLLVLIGRGLLPGLRDEEETREESPAPRGRKGAAFKRWVKRYIGFLIFIAGVIIVGLLLPTFMSILRLQLSYNWLMVIWVGVTLAVAIMMAPQALSRFSHPANRAGAFVLVFTTLLFLASYIIFFGRIIYPSIPFYLGGGEPQKVQMIVEIGPPVKRALSEKGIQFEAGKNDKGSQGGAAEGKAAEEGGGAKPSGGEAATSVEVITSVDLILATENEYIVSGAYTAVTIPRDAVKAIIYKNPYSR
jgi:hypothetical protein